MRVAEYDLLSEEEYLDLMEKVAERQYSWKIQTLINS